MRAAAGVGEVVIAQWKTAGLVEPSMLKPALATIERGLVLRRLGRLEMEDRRKLREMLLAILGP